MASILYVGHATTLIELDGVQLVTDPLLRRQVAHLRRLVPLGETLPRRTPSCCRICTRITSTCRRSAVSASP